MIKEELVRVTQKQGELEQWLQKKRSSIEDLLKRRFFYRPSFEIYGGVSGLYDYGPPGCSVKRELEDLWRRHFVLEEDMLELSGTNLTPEVVLTASGHVEKFSDYMVKEQGTEKCYRADKLLSEFITEKLKDTSLDEAQKHELAKIEAQADTYNAQQLWEFFERFQVKAPGTENSLTYPEPFNLMFSTSIGPTGRHKGFLRPETAQGIFVNFKNLYEFNRQRLPFAAAQIGLGFRNEISPRDGLLRVREFTMAEIEHFVNPKQKDHPKFESIADTQLPLLPQEQQAHAGSPVPMTIREAVSRGIIDNQTLGYFIGRTYRFLLTCGISEQGIRFRQHMPDEMAHYATDCWDAEILTSYGWVECVGIADRSCFDLARHAQWSKKNMMAAEKYPEPVTVEFVDMKPNKGMLGKTFKAKAQVIMKGLEQMQEPQKKEIMQKLEEQGQVQVTFEEESFTLEKGMINPVVSTKTVSQDNFYPSVIEPSFGIGRILYAVFEHAYKEREDLEEVRSFLSLPPKLAPTKCCILPISKNSAFEPYIVEIKQAVKTKGVSCEVDDSSTTIGRKYARCDELGIPFAITIDFQTDQDKTVTLREANYMSQVRLPISEVPKVVAKVVDSLWSWQSVTEKYPSFSS